MPEVSLKEVFTAGGQPTVTYVDRTALGLEKKLRKAVTKGHSVIAITGPTKSGKTVLCKKVVQSKDAVWIEGGQISNEADFWAQTADLCSIPSDVTRTDLNQTENDVGGKGSASLNVGLAKLTAGTSATTKGTVGKSVSRSHKPHNKLATFRYLRETERALVVDDFHYVDALTQKNIVRAIKAELFSGLTVIFISVPHRAFDPINVEQEMQGRFVHIEIPIWADSDLEKIPEMGFSALNTDCPRLTTNRFVKESFGSPLLMQNFCFDLCFDNDIEHTQSLRKTIPRDFDLHSIFESTATNFGFPTFDRLSKGPQARSDRKQRIFANDTAGDIYEAVLHAIALTGPTAEVEYESIRGALRQVLSGEPPQKHEVVRALGHISAIAKDIAGSKDPALEWVPDRNTLYITDPFFQFYLKWKIATMHTKS